MKRVGPKHPRVWVIVNNQNMAIQLTYQSSINEDSDSLPDPDVIAAEIVDDLNAALQEMELILGDLNSD